MGANPLLSYESANPPARKATPPRPDLQKSPEDCQLVATLALVAFQSGELKYNGFVSLVYEGWQHMDAIHACLRE